MPVSPKPDSGLLLPCEDPVFAAPASDNDIGAMLIVSDDAYRACKQRHADLVKWERSR